MADINDPITGIYGTQPHPFQCTCCNNRYREHRHAAKCCRVAPEDLRDGTVRDYDEVYEAMKVQEDEVRFDAIMAQHPYECSCGESFRP